MKLFFIILIAISSGCNFDVNTADLQASESIENSKKDGLFIEEFSIEKTKNSSLLDEAWLEFIWKNKLRNSKVSKTKAFGRQLVLKFDPKKFNLDPFYYIESWQLKDSIYGVLGSSNGLYTIDLKDNPIPKNFHIDLIRLLPTESYLYKIHLNANGNVSEMW